MANIDDCFRDFVPEDMESLFRMADMGFTPRDAEKQPMVEIAPILNPREGMGLVDRFRPKMEVFKGMQEATGVPFYDWWYRLEEGRAGVEAMTHEAFKELTLSSRLIPTEQRKMAQVLLEAKFQNPAEFEKMRGLVPAEVVEYAGTLESIVKKFFADHVGDESYAEALKSFPKFRKANGINAIQTRGSVTAPKPMTRNTLAEVEFRDMDERDLDPAVILRRYFRAVANEKHLHGTWREIDTEIDRYRSAVGAQSLTPYFGMFHSYRYGMQHVPDDTQIGLNSAFRNIMRRIGIEVEDTEAADLVSVLTSANYFANMSFQVGMVARNYLQTLQTTFPILGSRFTKVGLKQAVKWYRDPEYRLHLENLGVVARDAYAEPLREVARLAYERNSYAAKAMGAFFNFMEKGTTWYQTADNFNKVAAYEGQKALALDAIKKYRKHGDFGRFYRESILDMRDSLEGPLSQQVKYLLDQGKDDVAAHMIGIDLAKHTQFVYSRGNEAQILSSSMGRLFGQYGTWPTWYANFLGTMFVGKRGMRHSANARKAVARWTAVNSAMLYGMSEAFNVEFARWTFFAPLAYQGGPIAQIAGQASDVIASEVTGEEDPVARINAGRMRSAARQVLPVPSGALNTYLRAVDEAQKGNWAEASRRFLGLPTKED